MDTFLQHLNEKQREAVLYNEGPNLVIAGAGSGKTRVLTYKIAYLLKNGVSPTNILALTFTNKAAREMKSRIAEIVGDNTARLLWMGTFHSIFYQMLRREAKQIGFHSNFTIYDTQDSKNLIKNIIKEKALDNKTYEPAFVQNVISKAKNHLTTPEPNYQLPYIHDIYLTYSNRCKMANAMDFDDLLLYTYSLFNESNGTVQRYQNQFQFILVDEYQDVNFAQHEIIRQLAAKHHRVCAVGDDAQSIYSFRGANISYILGFQKNYPKSKLFKLFKLEQNYRSMQTIVNAANSLICKNKEQIPKTVYSKKTGGEKPRVISTYSDYEEGYTIANRIMEMRMLNKYEYKDFAILYRTNAQSRIFEESLRKINIPYKIYGGLSFYQRKEIKDVIAYMRLVTNPTDEEAMKRIINYPSRGIGDITINKIIAASNSYNTNLWEILSNLSDYNLKINDATIGKLEKFKLLIKCFIDKSSTENAYNIGQMIVKETGLLSEFYENQPPENVSRIQNINELINSLYTFVSSHTKEGNTNIRINDFLEEVSLLTDQDTDKDEDTNRVTMMTIHASKGLEFKNVFVVGLEEELFFPPEFGEPKAQNIEEERRLFYVAITRAKENVTLSYAKSRFRKGQLYNSPPSRFIGDIDKRYLSLPLELHNYINSRKLLHLKNDKPDSNAHYQNIGNLNVGNKIRHNRFGKGKIIALAGENDNVRATVEFEHFGCKQLLLKFARFEIIEN